MTGLFAPRNIGIGFTAAVAAIAAVYGYQAWSARPPLPPTQFVPPASYAYAKQDDGDDEIFEDPVPPRPPSPEVD
jgi:hypothetical protein